MTKSHIKLIMELIFIFILPLGIILASISCEKAMTYDENGNQLTEEKHIEYNNVILNEGTGKYINYVTTYELNKNNTNINSTTNWTSQYPTGNPSYSLNTNTQRYGINTSIKNKNYTGGVGYLKNSTAPWITNHWYYFKIEYTTGLASTETTRVFEILYPFQTASINIITLPNVNYNEVGIYKQLIKASYNTPMNSTLNIYYDYIGSTGSSSQSFWLYNIELIDISEIWGVGNEPTTTDDVEEVLTQDWYEYNENGIELSFLSDTPISSNYEEDLTIWGKLKNLIIENLQLTDNIIIDIILSYTIIWFIMFIIWHFFYLFFDMLVHIFIDWGHREKEKVK